MNTQKIALGGLVAGIVILILDGITNMFILKARFDAELNDLNPRLVANLENLGTIVRFAIIDLVLGVVLVWLYAAIRPRFGAGPKTAMIAGVFFWITTGMIWAMVSTMGFFSWTSWMLGGIAWLVTSLASAHVGGMIYNE